MTTYYMCIPSGSVDTKENWISEAREAIKEKGYLTWQGIYFGDDKEDYTDLTDAEILADSDFLVEVEKDEDGEWQEVE